MYSNFKMDDISLDDAFTENNLICPRELEEGELPEEPARQRPRNHQPTPRHIITSKFHNR